MLKHGLHKRKIIWTYTKNAINVVNQSANSQNTPTIKMETQTTKYSSAKNV